MNAQLLTYLVSQMIHATEAKDRRTANDILLAAIATAQAHALSNPAPPYVPVSGVHVHRHDE